MTPSSESTRTKKSNLVDEAFIVSQCELLLKEAGITKAPVDPSLLGSLRDVRHVEERDMPEAGMLIPLNGGGLHIHLRSNDSEERKKFTHFHEIAHTFFPDFQVKPQKRVDLHTGQYNKKDQTEYLCDLAASHLLMPDFLFQPEFQKLGFTIEALEQLHSIFHSSLEATGLKMVNQAPKTTGFVVWEKKLKPTEKKSMRQGSLFPQQKPEEKLRVKFGAGLDAIGHIPPDKSCVEGTGIIETAFTTNQKMSGTETIDFGNFKDTFIVDAMPVGGSNPRVLTLLQKI